MIRTCMHIGMLSLVTVSLGCATMTQDRREAAVREQTVIANLQSEVQRLKARVDGIESAQQDVFREVESVRGAVQACEDADRANMDRLEQAIRTLDSSRAQDREAIVNTLSKKIEGVVKQSVPSRRGAAAQQGYEHVVAAGETLSEIAKAYNSRVSLIIQANNIKDPNRVAVGQKLFIPE